MNVIGGLFTQTWNKVLPPFEKESTLCVWSQITPVLCMTRSWNFTWIIFNPFLNTPQNFTLLLPGIFEKWVKTFALSRSKLVRNRRKWANPLIRNCKNGNALTPKCMKIPHMWTFFFKRRKYLVLNVIVPTKYTKCFMWLTLQFVGSFFVCAPGKPEKHYRDTGQESFSWLTGQESFSWLISP